VSELSHEDQYGRTPLFYVRNDRAFQLLVIHGANVHLTDHFGYTALQVICGRTVCKHSRPLPISVSLLLELMLDQIPYEIEHDILRLIFGEATLLKFAEKILKQLSSCQRDVTTEVLIAFEALFSLVLNLNPYKPSRCVVVQIFSTLFLY